MANVMTGSSSFLGNAQQLRVRQGSAKVCRSPISVRAESSEQIVARRSALGLMAGAAALLTKTGASQAAFGDAARVFGGKATNVTGFVAYNGDGFAILLPSKWNPSKEQEFPGTALRYEDNGDQVNNLNVLVKQVGKSSITELGAPKDFLEKINYLFGDQVFTGETRSEGGFKANKVSAISVLDYGSTEKDGKTYYTYELLSRTADGDEGGRHNLITAVVNNGNLYLCKIQAGDKRWFKGAEKFARGSLESFKVV